MPNKTRQERDSLGSKRVPSNAYYGIYSQRFNEIFQLSDRKFPLELRNALVQIKIASAMSNRSVKMLDKKRANAIEKAGKLVLKGKYDSQFQIDAFQAGAGTPYNMNTNEVLSNIASEILGKKKGSKYVHPNDHVNMAQSSNDVVPTATRIASLILLRQLLAQMRILEKELISRSNAFSKVFKSGRTHLQDAVPCTLGQDFNAYAVMVRKNRQNIEFASKNVAILPIGGTAIGTGVNSHPRFKSLTVKNISRLTGLKFKSSKNPMAEMQSHADIAMLSNSLSVFAGDLGKIANDLRLLSSGPRTGLAEIELPGVVTGSSIMSAKINPSIPEMVNMVCFQAQGNNLTISKAAEAGDLELNVFIPIIALNMIESIKILSNASGIFSKHCIHGIRANKDSCDFYFDYSAGIPAVLNPVLGYDETGKIVKESLRECVPFSQLVLDKKLLTEKQLNLLLKNSAKPNAHLIKKLKKKK